MKHLKKLVFAFLFSFAIASNGQSFAPILTPIANQFTAGIIYNQTDAPSFLASIGGYGTNTTNIEVQSINFNQTANPLRIAGTVLMGTVGIYGAIGSTNGSWNADSFLGLLTANQIQLGTTGLTNGAIITNSGLNVVFPASPISPDGSILVSSNYVSLAANNTIYNDVIANTYSDSNNISDMSARSDLIIAVNELNKRNVFSNLIDAWMFSPRFASTNKLSLLLNTYFTSNAVYGNNGMDYFGTNFLIANLPKTATNASLFVLWRSIKLGDLDNFINAGLYNRYGAGLRSSVDNSSMVFSSWGNSEGYSISSSAGTNWFQNLFWASLTNRLGVMLSGAYRIDDAGAPLVDTVHGISGLSTGRYTAWTDGKPDTIGQSPAPITNQLAMAIPTAPFDTLVIGGDPAWNASWALGYQSTNLYGMELVGAIAFNTAAELNTNIPAAAYAFLECLEKGHTIVSLQGSSIINNRGYSGHGGTCALTNDMSVQFAIQHPDWIVKNEGAPGSTLSSYTNMSAGWSNGIQFQRGVVMNLPSTKFTDKRIFTDAPRNDSFNGTLGSLSSINFSNFYTPYINDKVSVSLIYTHWPAGLTQSLINGYTNWAYTAGLIEQQFPVSGFFNESRYMPIQYLQVVSADSPPTHINSNSIACHNANVAYAQFLNTSIWPTEFSGGTNVTVSTGTFLYTNIYPYPVTAIISGGTITGVAKNSSTSFNITVSAVRLGLGDYLSITNTVAPTLFIDTTIKQ